MNHLICEKCCGVRVCGCLYTGISFSDENGQEKDVFECFNGGMIFSDSNAQVNDVLKKHTVSDSENFMILNRYNSVCECVVHVEGIGNFKNVENHSVDIFDHVGLLTCSCPHHLEHFIYDCNLKEKE